MFIFSKTPHFMSKQSLYLIMSQFDESAVVYKFYGNFKYCFLKTFLLNININVLFIIYNKKYLLSKFKNRQ